MEAREPRAQTLAAPSGTMTPTSLDRLQVWYSRCSSAMSSSPASSAATSAPHSGRTEADTSLRSGGSHRRRTPCVRSNTLKSLDSADPKIDIQSRDLRLGFIFLRQDIHAPLQAEGLGKFTWNDFGAAILN